MAFKRKYRSRPWKKSRPGRSNRRYRRTTFKARVNRILNRKIETKYYDVASENNQLYHNLGWGTSLIPPTTVTSVSNMFNPWNYIQQGTARFNRIGDKITPSGMKLNIYLANKLDRQNTMIRVIVAVLPKVFNAAIVDAAFNPFQAANAGIMNNNMLLPADKDKGVKFLYDKIHHISINQVTNGTPSAKEVTKCLRLWIKRKRASPIMYDTTSSTIINKPLAVYLVPYEQFSTITTDNVASAALFMRMYYKDA